VERVQGGAPLPAPVRDAALDRTARSAFPGHGGCGRRRARTRLSRQSGGGGRCCRHRPRRTCPTVPQLGRRQTSLPHQSNM